MAAPASLFDLTGRTALITGAGSGLGRVMAQFLSAAGCNVLSVDINYTRAEETQGIIADAGGLCTPYECDVSDEADVSALEARLSHQRLNILINNAGVSTVSRKVHEIPVEEWDRVLAVNLRSAFLCTRAFVPHMLGTAGPSIINISSIVGSVALNPRLLSQASYAASKAGMIGLTRQTAADYGEQGLRANAIAPGWLMGTDLGSAVGNWSEPAAEMELMRQAAEGATLRRPGDKSEIVGLALFLASDASSFVTGQIYTIDGGWTTW